MIMCDAISQISVLFLEALFPLYRQFLQFHLTPSAAYYWRT